MGYNPFQDEPDMWIKPKVEIDGDSYYSYILCYVYDILFVHQNYMTMISNTNNYFKMKPDSIGDPGMYLEDSVGTSDVLKFALYINWYYNRGKSIEILFM